MLSPLIPKKLARLRQWESLLRLLWGLSRWIAVVIGFLALAALIDWLIDLYYPTPWPLRVGLFAVQLALAIGLALWWLFKPMSQGLSDTDLALLVEEKTPSLKHRLISVLQFHRPGANVAGMSTVLIAKVTEEAHEQTRTINFLALADHRRLRWSALLLLPVLALAALCFALIPETCQALLARQFLQARDIPRSVYVERMPDTPKVWPKGEEVVLRFQVHGSGWTEQSEGLVRVDSPGLPSEYYPLKYANQKEGKGEFVASLPASYANVTYRAWLVDGRTPHGYALDFEPRPIIEAIDATVLLPTFCGVRPGSGLPYELEQARGDVVAIFGSSARLKTRVQKPIKSATVQLLGPPPPLHTPAVIADCIVGGSSMSFLSRLSHLTSAAEIAELAPGPERILSEHAMAIAPGETAAEVTFPLPKNGTGYRIVVLDQNGFRNIPAPRRGIRIIAEEAPQVALLPDQFPPDDPLADLSSLEDFQVDGAPIPAGRKFRIAYNCFGPYGLGMARLRFRILKKSQSPSGSAEGRGVETPWLTLPLSEVKAGKNSGPFILRLGAFQGSPADEQIPFFAVPSPIPEEKLGRMQGGGRFDFATTKIPDGKGSYYALEPGDQIEYFIEVFADRNIHAGRPMAQSPSRLKMIVSEDEAALWVHQVLQEERRIRQLEQKQQGVFPLGGG